jgi:sortase A
MRRASRCLRRVELVLWIVGISLLGVALGATFDRWRYQVEQERALFQPGVVDSRQPRQEEPSPQASPGTAGPEFVPASSSTTGDTAAREARQAAPAAANRRGAADPTAFGRIEIPRLGVAAIVREGADERTLARAVGLVPGTAHPGERGNAVLAGHRDTFFRPLRKIRVNDRIRVLVPPEEYEYRVDSLRVVSPEETDVLESNGVEKLTLVTCYPFRFVGPAPDRFIVSATRVD